MDNEVCITSGSDFYYGQFLFSGISLDHVPGKGLNFKKAQILEPNFVIIPDQGRSSKIVLARKSSLGWDFKEGHPFKFPITTSIHNPFYQDSLSKEMIYRGLVGTGSGCVTPMLSSFGWEDCKISKQQVQAHFSVTSISSFQKLLRCI
ncbi:hypothetical protein GEMRC1_005285 [Eukaryota sp. GEM-RC1]